MSDPSTNLNTIHEVPTTDPAAPQEEHQISLIDQERGGVEEEPQDAERNNSEAPTIADSAAGGQSPITQKLTRNPSHLQSSLKRQWTKRKYAKYDRDRYDFDSATPPPEEENHANQSQIGDPATAQQTSYLERSRAKAKNILLPRRKRTLGTAKHAQDSVIDILYENQRGFFLLGIPRYSASSLLPNDPNAWQNAQFRASPVDIRNAQVPDPSWEWVWKSWYVDMSRDVDEEGWEYSFRFSGGFAWHGNHPWFHSFVRRRRWLRLRKRRDLHHHTAEKGHELTEEYFTIHPKTLKAMSEFVGNGDNEEETARLREKMEEDEELADASKMEIENIATLIHILRRSAVDREKLVAVRKFISTGSEDLYYLADRMEEIMNLFIFQSSRRQLLTSLLAYFDQASTRRQSLTAHQHDDDNAQREHDAAAQQAENLMLAVHAADAQVKRLEFWSDIKSMAQGGETLQDEGEWDLERWQGLSPTASASGENGFGGKAFASKQAASEGAPELHRHAEHPFSPSSFTPEASREKGKGRAEDVQEDDSSKSAVTAPSSKKSTGSRVQAVKHPAGGKESSTSEAEGYYTPAESASELPSRGNSKRNKPATPRLDGVEEGNSSEGDEPIVAPTLSAVPSRRQAKQSVQIVEPVPEPVDDRALGGRGGGGDGS